jgi:hypothetical protein
MEGSRFPATRSLENPLFLSVEAGREPRCCVTPKSHVPK